MRFTMSTSLIAGSLFVATPAMGQHDYNLLVAPQGADCFGDCVGPFSTFAEAMEAAALLPDVAGARPDVRIGLDPGQDLTETILIDNSGGQAGAPLRLDFAGRTICPDPASPPGEPAVVVRPGPQEEDVVARLVLDVREGGPCDGGPRPGVRFEGDGRGAMEGGLIAGTTDYAIKHTGQGEGMPGTAGLSVREVRIVDCAGVAIASGPFAWIQRVEIAGCVLEPGEDYTGLVGGGAGSGGLGVVHSAFVGNTIAGGAGGHQGLLVGPVQRLENSVFAGNALLDGQPVVRTGYVLRAWEIDGAALRLDSGPRPFHDLVFAHNAHIIEAPPPPDVSSLGAGTPPTAPQCVGDELLELDAAEAWLRDTEEGDGPIVAIDRDVGWPWDGDITLARSWFVGNRTGDRALVEVREGTSGTWIHMLHDTFAHNSGAPVLAAGAQLPDGGITVARNLHVDPDVDAAGPLIDASGVPGTVVVTDNATSTTRPWLGDGLAPSALLAGPNSTGVALSFRSQDWVVGLTPCTRASAISPDVDASGCEQPTAPPTSLSCAPGAAASWIASGQASPWPWQTAFFAGREDSHRGADGWAYSEVRAAIDFVPQDPGWGDGEGFPDLVDCDNFDAQVFPFVPEHDGVHSEYCVEPEGSCYRCPWGVMPPPVDDAPPDDDDDSAASGVPTAGSDFVDESGCGEGCGFSWGPDGLERVRGGLPLVWVLGWQRRRR